MTEVLLATGNSHKLQEFEAILGHIFRFLSLKDFPDLPDIEETGQTFTENAIIKAETLSLYTGKDAIADDSGLVVEALDGQPGVHSARYAGKHGDDAGNRKLLLDNLSGVSLRSAYFECVIARARPGQETIFFSGRLMGKIGYAEEGENGFGYDSVFIPDGYSVTLAQLSPKDKNAISHRKLAIDQLLQSINHSG